MNHSFQTVVTKTTLTKSASEDLFSINCLINYLKVKLIIIKNNFK